MEADDLWNASTFWDLLGNKKCILEARRAEEAEAFFKRELEIREGKSDRDGLFIANLV